MSNQSRRLWPTPRTMDGLGKGEHGQGGQDLRTTVAQEMQVPQSLQRLRRTHRGLPEIETILDIATQLPLLPADSLASLSVSPGGEEARKITAISGLKLSQLLKPSSPPGCCLKMLLESSTWHSTLCYLTWKVRTTPMKRLFFQLVPSTPHTDGIECGLWATPQAMDCLTPKQQQGLEHEINEARKGRTNFANLKEQAVYGKKMLPTPQATEARQGWQNRSRGKKGSQESLSTVVRKQMLPTPDANIRGARVNQNDHQVTLQDVTGGQLNPNWVEWLMGFPIGWSDLNV